VPDRVPGSLGQQWQDELGQRFHLPFQILTNDKLEAARTGDWFLENNLVIARLDKLSRNEDVQAKLTAPGLSGACGGYLAARLNSLNKFSWFCGKSWRSAASRCK